MAPKLIIGLTGGIGSGKSQAASFFRELGAPVIDADEVAREVVQPGQKALAAIVEKFGQSFLNADGSLNRSLLREKIFNDEQARLWLENLLHPLILEAMFQQAESLSSPYCILVIPLLCEVYPLIQKIIKREKITAFRVLVIDAPQDLQLSRTQSRDQLSISQVEKMLATQAPRDQRLKIANDVIENNGTLAQLKAKVEALHHYYVLT